MLTFSFLSLPPSPHTHAHSHAHTSRPHQTDSKYWCYDSGHWGEGSETQAHSGRYTRVWWLCEQRNLVSVVYERVCVCEGVCVKGDREQHASFLPLLSPPTLQLAACHWLHQWEVWPVSSGRIRSQSKEHRGPSCSLLPLLCQSRWPRVSQDKRPNWDTSA